MSDKIGYSNLGNHRVARHAVRGAVLSLVAAMVLSTVFCPVALAAGIVGNATIASDGPAADIDGVLGDAGPVVTFPHTIGSGANRILVVGTSAEGIGAAFDIVVTSVTYNSVTMFAAGSAVADNGPGLLATLHYLLDTDLPAAGTYDVVVTYSSGTISMSAAALSLENFVQQAPEALGSGAAPNNDGTFSTDITTVTADALLVNLIGAGDSRLVDGDFFTSNSGMTIRADEEIGTQDTAIATKAIATPGLQAISWDYPSPNRMAQTIAAFEALPSPPTVTIARVGATDSAFVDTTGSWTVDFSENVSGVTSDDFSLNETDTANASGGPTLGGSSPSFTVGITGVSGTGTIGLNFLVNDVVATVTSLAPAAQNNAAAFSNVVPAPAATSWVLVFLGVVLALAAAVVIRKRGLKH